MIKCETIIIVGQAKGTYKNDAVSKEFEGMLLMTARPDGAVIVHNLDAGVRPLCYIGEGADISLARNVVNAEIEVYCTTEDGQHLTLEFTEVIALQGVPTETEQEMTPEEKKEHDILNRAFNKPEQKFEELWKRFDNIPIDNDGNIEEEFENFPVGTDREEVWHWFEKEFNISVGDILTGKTENIEKGETVLTSDGSELVEVKKKESISKSLCATCQNSHGTNGYFDPKTGDAEPPDWVCTDLPEELNELYEQGGDFCEQIRSCRNYKKLDMVEQ